MSSQREQTNTTTKDDGWSWSGRAILLVDLDAFFASVEQLDHPAWRGKPVIVGGDPDKRGVVSTASYQARAYGVRSAMPSVTAQRLCPDAIWTQGNFSRYREVSQAVMDILLSETPHVLQVSIDEAFLDVTPTRSNTESPVAIARRIQTHVEKLGITCSIGVGTSKSIAKLASEQDKPQGLTVVYPGGEAGFIEQLPVRSLSGIGTTSEKKLIDNGIETLGDLSRANDDFVLRLLGKNGRVMLDRVRGLEPTDIMPDDTVKSVSNETSFAVDLTTQTDIQAAIGAMALKVGRRLRLKKLSGHTITLKLRFGDRAIHTIQRHIGHATNDDSEIEHVANSLLARVWQRGMSVRLVGVAVSDFDTPTTVQTSLFDASLLEESDEEFTESMSYERTAEAQLSYRAAEREKRKGLSQATDAVRDRFGDGAVRYGKELRTAENTTGSSSKNPVDYR